VPWKDDSVALAAVACHFSGPCRHDGQVFGGVRLKRGDLIEVPSAHLARMGCVFAGALVMELSYTVVI